ncbi:MAG: hypothetical protein HQ559_04455, partial [Lentisphaerae bacterium]|nr:hypothetical protein [Lentisphaerota bacterium]
GPIVIGGDATDWTLDVHSNVSKIAADYFTDVTLAVNGILGTLQGIAYNGGSVDVERLKVLKMLGTRNDATDPAGFNAVLTLGDGGLGSTLVKYGDFSGATSVGSIGNIKVIDGDIVGSIVSMAGRIGHITCIGGSVGPDAQVTISAPGDIGNITTKVLRQGRTRQGGGLFVDVDTQGRLGNVTTYGGDIAGQIHAANGMGHVKAKAILRHTDGKLFGIPYSFNQDDILPAHMAANLTAEPGEDAVAIKSISALGGNITGDVDVVGRIGRVLTKCYAYFDMGSESVRPHGGELSSKTFRATRVGNIQLGGNDIDTEEETFSTSIVATQTIGNVKVLAGGFRGTLTAGEKIGDVSVRVLVVGAESLWGMPDEAWVFGGPFELTLGNPDASFGKIRGYGVDVELFVDPEPNPLPLHKLASTSVKYRALPGQYETIGGDVYVNGRLMK